VQRAPDVTAPFDARVAKKAPSPVDILFNDVFEATLGFEMDWKVEASNQRRVPAPAPQKLDPAVPAAVPLPPRRVNSPTQWGEGACVDMKAMRRFQQKAQAANGIRAEHPRSVVQMPYYSPAMWG